MYIIPARYGLMVGQYGIQAGQNTVIGGNGFYSKMKQQVRGIADVRHELKAEGGGFNNIAAYKFESKTPRFLQKARNNIRFQK